MSVKPFGRIDSTRRIQRGVSQLGNCPVCQNGVYSNQPYARVQSTPGKTHLDCVPPGATVLKVVEAVKPK